MNLKVTNQRDEKEAMKTFAKHYLEWLREFRENRFIIRDTRTGRHSEQVENILIDHINCEIKRFEKEVKKNGD